MSEDTYEPKYSFDDLVDEYKRQRVLWRMGPAMPLTKRPYGLTWFDLIAGLCVVPVGFMIVIALQ